MKGEKMDKIVHYSRTGRKTRRTLHIILKALLLTLCAAGLVIIGYLLAFIVSTSAALVFM